MIYMFDEMFDEFDRDKLFRYSSYFITFVVLYIVFTMFIVYIGGIVGISLFFIFLIVVLLYYRRRKRKAFKEHEKLLRSIDKSDVFTYDLRMAGDILLVEIAGDVKLCANINDRDSIRILLRDIYIMLSFARNRNMLPRYLLESQVIADLVTSLGYDVESSRKKIKKDILNALNKLMDLGYFDIEHDISEICDAVRGQLSLTNSFKYHDSVIKRVINDVEIEYIKKLHEDDRNVVFEDRDVRNVANLR